MVTAKKYVVAVTEGTLAWIHGATFNITEYWIPSEKICFNVVRGELHVFREEKPRDSKKLVDIELDHSLVTDLVDFLRLKENLIEIIKHIKAS